MKEKDSEEDDENLLSPILSTHLNLAPTKGSTLSSKAVGEKRSGRNKGSPTFGKKSKKLKRKKLINPLSCTFFTDTKSSVIDEPTVKSDRKHNTLCGNTVDFSIQKINKEEEENVLSPIILTNHDFQHLLQPASSVPPLSCKATSEEVNYRSISPTFDKKFKKLKHKKLIDPSNCTFFLDAEVSGTNGLTAKSNDKFSDFCDNGSDFSIRNQSEADEENGLSPTLSTNRNLASSAVSFLPHQIKSGGRKWSSRISPTFDKKLTKSKCKKQINPLNSNFLLDSKSSVMVDDSRITSGEKHCASNKNDYEGPVRKLIESKTADCSAKPMSEELLTSKIDNSNNVLPEIDLNEENENYSPELVSVERASPVDAVSPVIQIKRNHFDSSLTHVKNGILRSASLDSKRENSLEDCLKMNTRSSSSSTDIIEASDDSKQSAKTTLQNFRSSSIRSSLLSSQKLDEINEEGASHNAQIEEGGINRYLDSPNSSPVFKKSSLSTPSNCKTSKPKLEIGNNFISKQNQASIVHPAPNSNDLNSKDVCTDSNFMDSFPVNEAQELDTVKHHGLPPGPFLNKDPPKEFCVTAETWISSTKSEYRFSRNEGMVSPEFQAENHPANYNLTLSGTRKRLSFHSYSSEKKRIKSVKPAFKLELKKTNHVESQFRRFSKFCKLNSSLSTKSPSTLTTRKSKIKKFDSSTDKKTRTKTNFEYSENCNFDRTPSPVLQQKVAFDSLNYSTEDGQGYSKEVENPSSKLQNCQDDEMKLEETEDYVLDEPDSPVLKTRQIFNSYSNTPQTPHNFSKTVETVSKKLLFNHKESLMDESKNLSENNLDSNGLSPLLNSRKTLESKTIIPDFNLNFCGRASSVRKLKMSAKKETVFSENDSCRNVPECTVNSLSPLLEAHKNWSLNFKKEVNVEHWIKGDHTAFEADDPINSTNASICDISILEDGQILNETVVERNPESEKVNLTTNRIIDDEITCSQVVRSISNQCSMDIDASESSATQQSRISEGNLPCDDVKATEPKDSGALTPESKQESIDDAVYESGKKRKRRYKSGTLSARLNRLLNRTRSETRMWAHEQQNESPCCLSLDLVVVKVSYEMNKWLLHCRISSSLETDQNDLSYFVFLDPFTINNALVTPGAVLKIFPRWQTLDLSSPKVIVIFNTTRVKLMKKTSSTEVIANSVPAVKSSCLESPYCSCPRDVVSTTCSHNRLKRNILLGSLISTHHDAK